MGCESQFAPQYKGHICCSQGCWTAILHEEIGQSAAGMRPFGMFGDRKKLKAVRLKYERLSRARMTHDASPKDGTAGRPAKPREENMNDFNLPNLQSE